MMRIPFLLLLFCSIRTFAQDKATADVTRATFFSPGIGYEKSIGRKTTLLGHAYLSPMIWFSYFTSSQGAGIHVDLDPTVQLQYRYYYNFDQRQAKENRTERNSMNYVSSSFTTTFTQHRLSSEYPRETARHATYTLGLLWGLQRNGHKRFSLDLNLGLGYRFSKIHLQGPDRPITIHENELAPIGNIHLGFWLNRH